MSISWEKVNDQLVALSGKLSQSTVPSLLPIKKLMQTYNGELKIDLSQLKNVDSAGLAFLIELKQYSDENTINVQFEHATDALTKLIALYNAEPLLEK